MPEMVIDPQDGTPPLALDWIEGYAQHAGPLGLGLPPRKLIERVRGDGHGTDLVGTRIGAREITIPLDVYAKDRPTFLARRRRLQQICGRSSHNRKLRVTYVEDGGASEWIEGVYVGGLEGDDGSTGEDRSELFAVVLRDGCPYWRGPRENESWGLTPPPRRNWFPLLRRSPAAGLVGGLRTVNNPGDVEVRPPWVIHGPGSGLTIHNHTAGWRVDIGHALAASGPGAELTVTTEFGAQSVRDGYGNNLFATITNGATGGWEMGPLLPGDNEIEVRLDGSQDGVSSITVAYDPLLLAV